MDPSRDRLILDMKVELPLSLINAMKTSGEWRYSSTILDLGFMWR
jgi:hypothetical protein